MTFDIEGSRDWMFVGFVTAERFSVLLGLTKKVL
jgi:hypothetical protein